MEPTDAPEARVVITGEPVEANEALFAGSLEEARDYVLRLPDDQRAAVSIVTDGRIYHPREL